MILVTLHGAFMRLCKACGLGSQVDWVQVFSTAALSIRGEKSVFEISTEGGEEIRYLEVNFTKLSSKLGE